MSKICDLLSWDTGFFGFNVARLRDVEIDHAKALEALEWCRANDIRCLYYLADSADAESAAVASALSFLRVDDRLTYAARTRNLDAADHTDIRVANTGDIPRLRDIARVSHTDSRFFNDPHFDRDRCGEFYERWIENSVNGEIADAAFVSEADGEVTGYITCSKHGGEGSIGLVAVASNARGRGTGKRLLAVAARWFDRQRLERVVVVTQGRNEAATSLYQKAGFELLKKEVWFHRWFN